VAGKVTSRFDRRRFLAVAAALSLPGVVTAAPKPGIPLATDLREDGRLSRSRKAPIVVLFSLPGCPYCEAVRRSHLAPMHADPKQAARVIIRQVDIDGEHGVVGFAGERTTHAHIARKYGMRSVPVVAFWDGNGQEVAAPLKGMLLPDFYGGYLDAALETAQDRLARGT
jgi:thioredoxin-related protein